MASGHGKLNSLQIVRGCAALLVLVYHLREYVNRLYEPGRAWVAWIPNSTAVGLLLFFFFFALSGYMLPKLLDERKHPHFLLRRIVRIYPAFLLAVAIALVSRRLLQGSFPMGFEDTLKAISLLPLQRPGGVLRIEWTLVYEVFFYLVCTLFSVGNMRRLYPCFLVLWAGLIVAFPNVSPSANQAFPAIALSTRNLYFIFGGLSYYTSAWWIDRTPYAVSQRTWKALTIGSLCLVVALYYLLTQGFERQKGLDPVNLTQALVYGPTTAFFLLAVAHLRSDPPRFLVRLGDHSYGIYLIHATVYSVLLEALAASGIQVGLPAVVLVFVCTFFAGWQFGRLDVAIQSLPAMRRPHWHPLLRVGVATIAVAVVGLDVRDRQFAVPRAKVATPKQVAALGLGREPSTAQGWGWFDGAKVEPDKTVLLTGWAVDRMRHRPPEELVVTAGNWRWPISVRWQPRPDAARATGLEANTELGWTASMKCGELSPGRHELNVFALASNGSLVPMRSRFARSVEISTSGDVRVVEENSANSPTANGTRPSRKE